MCDKPTQVLKARVLGPKERDQLDFDVEPSKGWSDDDTSRDRRYLSSLEPVQI